MPDFTLTVEDAPTPDAVQAIHRALHAHNRRMTGDAPYEPLTITLRDPNGNVIGGLGGATYLGWLYVDVLAIDEGARGRGYGARLLAMAEAEGLRRGAHSVWLDTFSFQALAFYQKQGYAIFGELENFTGGHTCYFLRKTLRPAPESSESGQP